MAQAFYRPRSASDAAARTSDLRLPFSAATRLPIGVAGGNQSHGSDSSTARGPGGPVNSIDDLLERMVARSASDLHLTVGAEPTVRVMGNSSGWRSSAGSPRTTLNACSIA